MPRRVIACLTLLTVCLLPLQSALGGNRDRGVQVQAAQTRAAEVRRARVAERKRGRLEKLRQRAIEQERRLQERQLQQQARSFRRVQVSGEEVSRNVDKLLTELRWHDDLASAQEEARTTGKPIVWIQALGDLDGFL